MVTVANGRCEAIALVVAEVIGHHDLLQHIPGDIEGVIRASLGEGYLLDEISPEDALSAQYQVIGKITAQHSDVSTRIDEFLTNAAALVAESETEEAQQ